MKVENQFPPLVEDTGGIKRKKAFVGFLNSSLKNSRGFFSAFNVIAHKWIWGQENIQMLKVFCLSLFQEKLKKLSGMADKVKYLMSST